MFLNHMLVSLQKLHLKPRYGKCSQSSLIEDWQTGSSGGLWCFLIYGSPEHTDANRNVSHQLRSLFLKLWCWLPCSGFFLFVGRLNKISWKWRKDFIFPLLFDSLHFRLTGSRGNYCILSENTQWNIERNKPTREKWISILSKPDLKYSKKSKFRRFLETDTLNYRWCKQQSELKRLSIRFHSKTLFSVTVSN